ncbi:uncharacterized protein LOC142580992 isoform X3 [Dermacentor variabilis]|uniref:uncharacterized protein LOC142580992 isoform X3 n=1 Tax=Dermacentor variabilis TaxID=34621 RepID=UPI003F5C0B8D
MAFGITSTRARAIAFFIPQSGREETLEAAQNSSAPGRGLPCQRPAVHGSNFDLYVAERSLGNFYARCMPLPLSCQTDNSLGYRVCAQINNQNK